MTSAAVLVPSKFIILITHLLVCLVIMQTKEGNIYASLPNNIDPLAAKFVVLDQQIQTATILTLLFIVIEIFILFMGWTMFYDKINILQCIIHGIGAILYNWFILEEWNYAILWLLWGIFSLFPLVLELLTITNAMCTYKVLT